LQLSHLTIVLFQFLSTLLEFKKIYTYSKLVDNLSLIVYLGAIFYTQSAYFSSSMDKDCGAAAFPHLSRWYLIEILSFYSQIVSIILYLVSSVIYKTGTTYSADKKALDFITGNRAKIEIMEKWVTFLIVNVAMVYLESKDSV
jgi:hypothetical protein